VHNNLAVALDHLGRREQALDHILRAAALKPDDFFIQVNSATGLLGAGRAEEAVPHFEAALRIAAQRRATDDPALRMTYAAALLEAGRPRAAVDELQRVLASDPNRAPARRLLAEAQRQMAEPP
jgi:predicted Zn-dependent protease